MLADGLPFYCAAGNLHTYYVEAGATPVLAKVYDQYGSVNRDLADRLKGRILNRMDPDHIHELQLGGSDTADNLRMLDRFTNQEIGMRQIWPQIRGLADYTPIKINVEW